jgi:Ca2+-binding RTX toxin-like protein
MVGTTDIIVAAEGDANRQGGEDEACVDDRGLGGADASPRRGVALAALRVGNDHPNKLFGTYGDNVGQDTILGFGAGDLLVGRSAADELAGGSGADRLYGNESNDTLDGGPGRDRIFTGFGFDFVYAKDGYKDYINLNGHGNYRLVFVKGLDVLDKCPSPKSATKGGDVGNDEQVVVN